jgi:hypothetical protein
MGKYNFSYLIRLKCEESSHYNGNCPLCQRCWLLCTSSGEYKAARLQTPGYLIHLRQQLRQQRIKLYNDQRIALVFNLFIYLLMPHVFRAFFYPTFRGRCTASPVVQVSCVRCQRTGADAVSR